MSEREAWIIDGVRTPRGKGKQNGALHHIHPQELLAQCLNAVVQRTGVPIRPRSRTSSPATPAASATTAPTSPAWPCSSPAGRSPRPA